MIIETIVLIAVFVSGFGVGRIGHAKLVAAETELITLKNKIEADAKAIVVKVETKI